MASIPSSPGGSLARLAQGPFTETDQPAALIPVFLVEDHPMTLAGLKLLLEQDQGLKIAGEATNGQDAVQRILNLTAQEDSLLVVLMDIGLPVMDGIEATQRLKQERPGLRVIMLTSKDSETDVIAAMAAGANGYCMKGIALPSLVAAIQAVSEGAAWLDPAVARLVLGRFQGSGMGGANAGPLPASLPITPPAIPCPLTSRELEVLRLIVDGLSNPEIAGKLFITQATAKAHVHSILQKLCVDDRTQAAVLAMRQGYV